MKNENIRAELAELDVSDLDSDSARGVFYWPRDRLDQFEEITAIRAHADWDITGKTGDTRGWRLALSVSIDERRNLGTLTIGLASWDFKLDGTAIKVINGAESGELMIRFLEAVSATRSRDPVTMKASSYLVVTDR